MTYTIEQLSPADMYLMSEYERKNKISYPYGKDTFTIDHGKDYSAFFSRMGTVFCFVIYYNTTEIVGTMSAVLRQNNTFYLCDLKVSEAHRNKGLFLKMLQYARYRLEDISDKMYFISMNAHDNEFKHVDKVLSAHKLSYVREKLWIYNISVQDMKIIKKHFNTISFISLAGIKDLILSSGQRIDVYHLQYDNKHMPLNNVPINARIMFVLPNAHPFRDVLKSKYDIVTDVSAYAYYVNCDRLCVLTSEI